MPRRDADGIAQHLAAFPPPQRQALETVRQSLRILLPGAEEVLAWGMPSFRVDGDLVLSFSGFSDHNSLFPGPEAVAATAKKYPRLVARKGTVHIPRDTAPPATLLRFVVRTRIAEINESYPKASGVSKALYDNGFLKYRGRVKDGDMHGEWVFFRRDGSRLRSGRFARGEQVGPWTTYDRSGEVHRVRDLG